MLIVRRRVSERVVVGDGIEITVLSATRGGVRLGIVAPSGVLVLRGEVHDGVVAANAAACASSPSMFAGSELELAAGKEPG